MHIAHIKPRSSTGIPADRTVFKSVYGEKVAHFWMTTFVGFSKYLYYTIAPHVLNISSMGGSGSLPQTSLYRDARTAKKITNFLLLLESALNLCWPTEQY